MPSFKITELLVPKKKTVKVLAIFINSCHSFSRRLNIKFDFDMQSCLKEKDDL